MGIKLIYVVDDNGREIDRVEYDDAGVSPAVAQVASALDVPVDQAVDLVAKNNPGAEKTSEENARALADAIAAKAVPDRDVSTYADGDLSVQDTAPVPVSPVLVKSEAAPAVDFVTEDAK